MLLKVVVLCLVVQPGLTKNPVDIENAELHRLSSNATDTIAFSADLSSTISRSGGSPIEFDRERANIGGLYFPDSGQFVCPDDGFYVFIWSLRKANVEEQPGMRCITKLQKGGQDVKFGPKTNYWTTATSGASELMTVTQCSIPEAVTVVVVPWSETPGTPTFFQSPDTSFSGFKLQYPVGFTVELSKTQLLFDGSRIRFDTIVSNFGRYYDDVDDCFRCPDDGLYVFSVSTHTTDPSTPWSVSRLMMGNEVVLHGPITYRATESRDSGSASTTAVLQCVQDSSVYVEAQAAFDFPYNSYSANLTSFSGYKLYDVDNNTVAFSVVMTKNVSILDGTERFSFDEVITNVGNAFDVNFGQFVCPDDDHYLFMWGTAAVSGQGWMRLHKDGQNVKHMYITRQTSSDTSGTSGSSSMSIIQSCTTGSVYYIEGHSTEDETLYLADYTTFSGFRVPGV